MNDPSRRLALVASLVLPLALAGASFAQPAPPPPPAAADAGPHHHMDGPMGGPMSGHWDPAQMRARMADHLRAVLQLQPGQEPALNVFLDAMRPAGGMRDHMGDDGDAATHLTTPERLDRMAARMDEHRTRMLAMIAATRQFYAQLTPSQQKAFDEFAPMMMMRHGMGGHGMGGQGMGGHGMGGRGMGHGDMDHDDD